MSVCIAVACFCAYAAYHMINSPKTLETRGASAMNNVKAAAAGPALGAAAAAGGQPIAGAFSQAAAPDQAPPAQSPSDGPRIQPTTKIIYKYTYSGDGLTTQTEAQAPYFFVNMDKQRLAESLPDWNIVSFGPDEIVLQKTVAGNSSQHYVVGAFNGYVAVFFRQGESRGGLMQVTKAPVYTFSQNEQEQLAKGINVDGDDNLYKVLQDYDS